MKKYEKPIVAIIENQSEGIYMASGCYTITATIHQRPEIGRGDYRIQIKGIHNADHTKESQILTINFNMPVEYVASNGNLINGNGSAVLQIKLNYHQNPNDNIGMGDLIIKADSGLSVVSVNITD